MLLLNSALFFTSFSEVMQIQKMFAFPDFMWQAVALALIQTQTIPAVGDEASPVHCMLLS